jgi:hypothetical protein
MFIFDSSTRLYPEDFFKSIFSLEYIYQVLKKDIALFKPFFNTYIFLLESKQNLEQKHKFINDLKENQLISKKPILLMLLLSQYLDKRVDDIYTPLIELVNTSNCRIFQNDSPNEKLLSSGGFVNLLNIVLANRRKLSKTREDEFIIKLIFRQNAIVCMDRSNSNFVGEMCPLEEDAINDCNFFEPFDKCDLSIRNIIEYFDQYREALNHISFLYGIKNLKDFYDYLFTIHSLKNFSKFYFYKLSKPIIRNDTDGLNYEEPSINYYTLGREMNFGKYKGKKIIDVIQKDLDYIGWCVTNIKDFALDCNVFYIYLLNTLLELYQQNITIEKLIEFRAPESFNNIYHENQKKLEWFWDNIDIDYPDVDYSDEDTFDALTDGMLGSYDDFREDYRGIDWQGDIENSMGI